MCAAAAAISARPCAAASLNCTASASATRIKAKRSSRGRPLLREEHKASASEWRSASDLIWEEDVPSIKSRHQNRVQGERHLGKERRAAAPLDPEPGFSQGEVFVVATLGIFDKFEESEDRCWTFFWCYLMVWMLKTTAAMSSIAHLLRRSQHRPACAMCSASIPRPHKRNNCRT